MKGPRAVSTANNKLPTRRYYGVAAPVAAVVSAVSAKPKSVSRELPRAVSVPVAATETKAAIRPYSMAVAPDSSARNDKINVLIFRGTYTSSHECLSSIRMGLTTVSRRHCTYEDGEMSP